MQCPKCKSQRSRVVDSRDGDYHRARVRNCLSCKEPFGTVEIVLPDEANVRVVDDGGVLKFDLAYLDENKTYTTTRVEEENAVLEHSRYKWK